MKRYDETILYGQIAVHDPREPEGCEDWTEADVGRARVCWTTNRVRRRRAACLHMSAPHADGAA